jgi:hypothetical protein
VAQVVRLSGHRGFNLCWGQGEAPGDLPDLGVGGRRDGLVAFTAEQASVGRDAEGFDVLAKDFDQNGRDGYRPDIVDGPVLEPAFLMRVAGIGPFGVDLGPGNGESDRAPALGWQVAVALARADSFTWLTHVVTCREFEDDPVSPARRIAGVLHHRIQTALAGHDFTGSPDLPGETADMLARSAAPASSAPANAAGTGQAPRPRAQKPRTDGKDSR